MTVLLQASKWTLNWDCFVISRIKNEQAKWEPRTQSMYDVWPQHSTQKRRGESEIRGAERVEGKTLKSLVLVWGNGLIGLKFRRLWCWTADTSLLVVLIPKTIRQFKQLSAEKPPAGTENINLRRMIVCCCYDAQALEQKIRWLAIRPWKPDITVGGYFWRNAALKCLAV